MYYLVFDFFHSNFIWEIHHIVACSWNVFFMLCGISYYEYVTLFYPFSWIFHYFQFWNIGNKVGMNILIHGYGWSYYSFYFSELRSGMSGSILYMYTYMYICSVFCILWYPLPFWTLKIIIIPLIYFNLCSKNKTLGI